MHFTHLDTVYQSISSYANTSLFHPCSFAYVYQHRFQFHNLIRWHLSRGHSTLRSADDLKRTINNLFTALMGLRHVASIGQLLIKAGRQTSKHINVELTLKQRWSSMLTNVVSTLIFGWKWKLSYIYRRSFNVGKTTLKKGR